MASGLKPAQKPPPLSSTRRKIASAIPTARTVPWPTIASAGPVAATRWITSHAARRREPPSQCSWAVCLGRASVRLRSCIPQSKGKVPRNAAPVTAAVATTVLAPSAVAMKPAKRVNMRPITNVPRTSFRRRVGCCCRDDVGLVRVVTTAWLQLPSMRRSCAPPVPLGEHDQSDAQHQAAPSGRGPAVE